jgi:hypothetical protein
MPAARAGVSVATETRIAATIRPIGQDADIFSAG